MERDFNLGPNDFKVDVTLFYDDKPASKSLIIMPPTGGTNIVDRSYAKKFCRAGYEVYIINGWMKDQETRSDLDIHQSFYSKAQRAINYVTDEIKTPFIGMMGTSVGALHASVASATNPKLDAVFVIVGGTPIAEVIVTSDQKAMTDLKATRKKRFGFKNDQENIEAIGKVFHLEPMSQGELFKQKALGMAIADNDSTVSTLTQNKLREFWKPKTVIEISGGHFWGIVKMWLLHSHQILEFFEESAKSKKS